MYVALDPIGSSSKPKKTPNKTSQTIKTTPTTQTTPQVDPLAAIAEEKRRKKIQEYKKLINDVKKANSEISESIDELVSTEKMIDKCITGEFANSIKNIIQNLQGQTENVMNDLNVIGTKAAQKVENEGEPCIYNKQQPNSEITYSGKNKTTFSCNTDVLRKQVLQGLETYKMKLAKPINSIANLPKLEGCEGVTNIPNSIDDIKKLATNLYNEVKSWIERAEQAEAENQRIVEQLGRENGDETRDKLETNKTSTFTATVKKIFKGINKATEKIGTEGIPIWKDGIEYRYIAKTATITDVYGYEREYRYYMLEPENPDPNIPTLFCLDGDGKSIPSDFSEDRMTKIVTTNSIGIWEQALVPLAGVNQGGLDRPNIRFIYLPNPTYAFRTAAMTPENFYRIVDEIVKQNDNPIDVNNMSILGHSARRKSCCAICEWYRSR